VGRREDQGTCDLAKNANRKERKERKKRRKNCGCSPGRSPVRPFQDDELVSLRGKLKGVHWRKRVKEDVIMENREHIKRAELSHYTDCERLKKGSHWWNEWRKENPGIIPDLSHADLHEICLAEVNLAGANLPGANLCGADLTKADFADANLEGADLSDSFSYSDNYGFYHSFKTGRAKLNQANLTRCRLKGARLRASLVGANLTGADLTSVDCSDSCFNDANLSEANLTAAVCNRSEFYGAKLIGANLCATELYFSNLENADLSRAHLIWTNLQYAKLKGTNLQEAILHEIILCGASFGYEGADLRVLRMNNVAAHGAIFSKADLTGTDFTSADLVGANLRGARLHRVNLRSTYLLNADLSDADLRSALGLTQEQLDSAWGNKETLLPPELSHPPRWNMSPPLHWTDSHARNQLKGAGLNSLASARRLPGSNLSHLYLPPNIQLSEADISHSDLYDAKLENAVLRKANLQRAILWGANLRGADLSDADLSGAYLFKADLTGTSISGAKFLGARGLVVSQVKKADGWQRATFDPEFRKQISPSYRIWCFFLDALAAISRRSV
jgi:uncharacterized protein YjbI with pentapeptide repeats